MPPLQSGINGTDSGKNGEANLLSELERLRSQVESLRAAFSIFEGLATPRMARLYQQSVGGLVAVASNSDWRMQGFYPVEHGSGTLDVAWTKFDDKVAIFMLLLKDETYSCALRLVRTPHIEAPNSIVVTVKDKQMAPIYDEDEQAYTFTFRAERTGWYPFSFNSRKCLQPTLQGGRDVRQLGVLFRSLTLVPVLG
jgi:hypothetical protein